MLEPLINSEKKQIETALHAVIETLEPAIRPLAAHVLKAGGKRIRPMLTVLCAKAFGAKDSALYTLSCALELLHAATLMHDDIVDAADTRRGKPAAHTVYGAQSTVLSGDAMLAATMLIAVDTGNFAIMRSVADAAAKTAAGEVEEIQNLGNAALSSEAYMRIITGKTAWLTRCACEVGALFAGVDKALVQKAAGYGLELGIAFQIVDDALDLAPASETGKPTGGDLREGKMTPPIRFYLDSLSRDESADFIAKFSAKSFSEQEITQIVGEMRNLGCDQKARELANSHLQRANEYLQDFPAGKYRDLLQKITNYVQKRNL